MRSNQKIIEVHISEIKTGDLVKCKDGFIRTIGKNNINYNSFMGYTLFGDSYKLGREKVQKVLTKRWIKNDTIWS